MAGDPSFTERANAAYTKNLIWKDSFGQGRGGDAVDQKRVLDLSLQRIDAIVSCEPTLGQELGQPLETSLGFFDRLHREVVPTLQKAVAMAAGNPL